MAQSESSGCVIPNRGVVQPREGSPHHQCSWGDPSLRLKNGSARDDTARPGFKLSHFLENAPFHRDSGVTLAVTPLHQY